MTRSRTPKRATGHPARRSGRHQVRKPGKGEPVAAEGIVSPNRAGFGFARVEGIEAGVFLPPREMSGLVQGDRVSLALHKDAQDRWVGTVKSVIERGLSAFLGVLEGQGQELRVRAADRRLGIVCNVPRSGAHGAQSGDWVIADIKRYPSDAVPGEAWVRRKLDPERPVEMATEAAIARFDLRPEFSPAVLQEARRFGSQVDAAESAQRIDLRSLPLVTIDGEDASDFDDAVYAERARAKTSA